MLKMIVNSFKNPEQSWRSFFIEMAILLAAVLFIRFYVFQFFQVSGPSMCPTLNVLDEQCRSGKGEFVFVNQVTYNFFRNPERGEVVVFRPPNATKDFYIKRVIGLPGDTVYVRNGQVYLEDVKIEEPYLSPRNQGRTQSDLEEFVVPEDHYVLFGDNRDRSLDSRRCYSASCSDGQTPFVHKKKIKGKAEFVIWPFWTVRTLDNPLTEY